jgi:hypothetical protein
MHSLGRQRCSEDNTERDITEIECATSAMYLGQTSEFDTVIVVVWSVFTYSSFFNECDSK